MSVIEPKLLASWVIHRKYKKYSNYKPKVLEVTPGGIERLVIDEIYKSKEEAEARAAAIIELMKKGEWHDNS